MYERYAGLIFGMDGAILGTEPTRRETWHEVLRYYGLRFDEHTMVALSGSLTWCTVQSVIELDHADLDPHALTCKETDKVRSMLLDSVRPSPSVDVMKAWHGRRPMSVGMSSESAIAEALLTRLGLHHYFDAVVTTDHVQHHKPTPDTFLLYAERMRVVPAHCVMFENADFGVQAAHVAGMDAVNVRLL